MPVWLANNNCSLLVVFVCVFGDCVRACPIAASLSTSHTKIFSITLLDRRQIIVVDWRKAKLRWRYLCPVSWQGLFWVITQHHHLFSLSLRWLTRLEAASHNVRRFARDLYAYHATSYAPPLGCWASIVVLVIAFAAFLNDSVILRFKGRALRPSVPFQIFSSRLRQDSGVLS